jgi:hypothetical protein
MEAYQRIPNFAHQPKLFSAAQAIRDIITQPSKRPLTPSSLLAIGSLFYVVSGRWISVISALGRMSLAEATLLIKSAFYGSLGLESTITAQLVQRSTILSLGFFARLMPLTASLPSSLFHSQSLEMSNRAGGGSGDHGRLPNGVSPPSPSISASREHYCEAAATQGV